MENKLVLIRHALTTARENTLVGKNDLPLSSEGEKDAARLAENIFLNDPAVKIFSSALTRARQTAEIIFPGKEIMADPRINEVDFGKWNGMTIQEIMENYPDDMDSWAKNPMSFCFPGGESVGDFILRINDFFNSVSDLAEKIVVVSHGGVIRFLICRLLKLDYAHHLAFQVDRPSVNIIDHDKKSGVLTGLNLTGIRI